MKMTNGKETIEVTPFTKNVYERYGFKEVEEDQELTTLREKAKELGIKSAHTMKMETLITKIAEITASP